VLEIVPPYDLLEQTLAKGLKESMPEKLRPNGIFSEDPVDLLNCLIELPTDIENVERLTREYQKSLAILEGVQSINQSYGKSKRFPLFISFLSVLYCICAACIDTV
jgi:hypothetical protein